jgi:hypothetical protein
MQHQDQSQHTGTRNETYDVIAVLYHALQGAENCQIYLKDAQDPQVRQFFEQAQNFQRQLADQGKQILQQVIQKDTGGQSAFGWEQSQSPGQSGTFSQGQSSFAEQGVGGGTGGSSSSF